MCVCVCVWCESVCVVCERECERLESGEAKCKGDGEQRNRNRSSGRSE